MSDHEHPKRFSTQSSEQGQLCLDEVFCDNEGLIRLVFNNSSVGIFTIKSDGRIGIANRRMSDLFSIPLDRLIGCEYISLVDPCEREFALKSMMTNLACETANITLERHYWRSNGTAFWGELTICHMPINQNGRPSLVCVVSDVTERKIAEQALADRSHELEILNLELTKTVTALSELNVELAIARSEVELLAQHDNLTGVWNRRRIEETAQQEMLRMTRYGHPVSLLFIDLDHFKQVNDTHGHSVGDEVLKAFCDIAQKCMRSTDLLGRWGGEEFVILMPNSGLLVAILLAERIRKATAAHDFHQAGRLTVSIGVAECRDEEAWKAWLSRSNSALYAAKDGGRNRVVANSDHPDEAGEVEFLDHSYLRLIWRTSYKSGHPVIDQQHRNLFEHANKLLTSVIGDRPEDEIALQIKSLVNDLSNHFRDEEVIFRLYGYPGADEHSKIHGALVGSAFQMLNDFKNGELSLGELFNFLVYSFIAKHVLSEDRKFFGLLLAAFNTEAEVGIE